MEVATYSQVVFNEIPQSYIPNTPVKCSYEVTAAIEPHRRDWVGIFKVGWSTTKDYYTFVWAAPSQGEEPVEQHVIFDAYYLPKEDGEFYQFCFVDSSGQVRGASIPFRFESQVESSLDYGMDKDLLVITTQEQVEQVEKEKEELHKEIEKKEESIKILRSELSERLLEIRCLRESMVELGQSVNRLEQEQAQSGREEGKQWASQQGDASAQQERERQILVSHQGTMREPIAQNTVGMEESQREREVLQQSLFNSQEKYQQAVTIINQLKQKRAELKEKVTTQEAEITQLSSSIREMELEKQKNLGELQTRHDHIILLQVDLQSSQKETVKLAGELRGLRAQAEALRRENQALQKTLSEQDREDREDLEKRVQCEVLTSQLQDAKEELRKERQSNEEAHSQTGQALQETQKELENVLKAFQQKDQLSSELEKQLMDAQKILDEQVNIAVIMRVEKDELSQDKQELKRNIEKLCEELAHFKALATPSSISLQYPNP
ncbi:hypothetical protein SKAU_G00138810 [Synaphobranchus kaupii]|uniref:SKICH domain-containing protein n=1 Tax=Synaphobranchus kaupii TaxID=118154 RepID=A0A9Q1FRU1_SYNKA|nr:hypothetical protein SKAU_G00138810 [Synaphobranchus kaupii]